MPKKNDAEISSKKSNPIPAIPIFNYFLTLKKYHAHKYTILSFNCMRIYSNVYNYAIYLNLLAFLCTLSIQ